MIRQVNDKIDVEILGSIKEIMKDKFPSIVEKFIDNSIKYIGYIRTGIANNNAAAISDSAHPLKSSSGTLGLIEVAEIAKQIEHIAEKISDNGGNVSDILPLLEQLESEFNDIKEPLQEEAKAVKTA